MFSKRSPLVLIFFLGVFLISGCSEEPPPPIPGDAGGSISTIVRGAVSRDLIDFEFAAELGEDIDPAQGALLVRGRNLSYDPELGALTVDLSVYNDSESEHPELVGMTFISFSPAGVTILNSDNDQDGAGSLVLFEFEDDDNTWSPGEESQPRNVKFLVDSGTSIGFVARIDVGLSPLGGTIGGMVWHDENEDGVIDAEEDGVAGVGIALVAGDDESVAPFARTLTASDGTYHFSGLDAGYYTVIRLPVEGAVGTTSSEIAVILVQYEDTVSEFLLANFGLARDDSNGGEDDYVRVGDYVDAKGDYAAEPDRLVSEKFKVQRCNADKHDNDDDDGCRQNDCWGRLTGNVTGLSWEERYVEVMGTKVFFEDSRCDDDDDDEDDEDKDRDHDDCDHNDWGRGVRVQVDAYIDDNASDGMVMACRKIHIYKGKNDKVKGFVQEVLRNEDGYITGVVVLNTLVTVPRHDGDSKVPVYTGSHRVREHQRESRETN